MRRLHVRPKGAVKLPTSVVECRKVKLDDVLTDARDYLKEQQRSCELLPTTIEELGCVTVRYDGSEMSHGYIYVKY